MKLKSNVLNQAVKFALATLQPDYLYLALLLQPTRKQQPKLIKI